MGALSLYKIGICFRQYVDVLFPNSIYDYRHGVISYDLGSSYLTENIISKVQLYNIIDSAMNEPHFPLK